MICSPFSASTKSKKISKAALPKSLVAFARTLESPIQFFIAGINLHLCFSFLIERRKITNTYFPRWQNHISQKRLFQYVLSPLPDKWKAPWGRGAAWASFAAVNIILFHFLCQHKTFSALLCWTEFNIYKIFDWWSLVLVCIGQLFVVLTSVQWAPGNHHLNFSQFWFK